MATTLERKIEVLKDIELAQKIHLTEGFEDFIPHMYLDSVGKVTIGIGHLLPSASAACDVLFNNPKEKRQATAAEITAEYNALAKLSGQQVAKSSKDKWNAKHFSGLTALRISDEAAYGLAAKDIAAKERELRIQFPDLDSYPQGVKEVLLDMAYNLGTSGLVNKFPKFVKAIRERNWKEAAKHSKRPQLGAGRNNSTTERLNSAFFSTLGDWVPGPRDLA